MKRALALLVVAIALFGSGFVTGKRAEHNANEARRAEAQQTAIELHNAVAITARTEDAKAVTRAARTEAVFNGITRGALTYAQYHLPADDLCHLDADGLRLWRDANAGADAAPAADGDGAVPAAAATPERHADGSAEQPHRGGEAVPPVPGPTPGADQLDGGD